MCGDSFYALGSGVASKLEKYGRNFLTEDIAKHLYRHDIVCCNVECVLSDINRNNYSLRSVHMRGRPQAAKYLADWGINIANVANNHILEQGYEAAVDTVANLQKAGINVAGAGKDDEFMQGVQLTDLEVSGRHIAFLNLCLLDEYYAFNGGVSLEQATDSIWQLRSQGKSVIVSVHWGNELMDRPDSQQKFTARKLVEAGALLVIGHHPHVVQGIEEVNGGLIAYSLGNFIFDSFWKDSSWSFILSVTLEGDTIVDWQCVPVEKDPEHRPQLTQGYRKEQFKKEFGRRCSLLNSEHSDQQYLHEYKMLRERARRQLHHELLKNTIAIDPVFWPQILYRFIRRRIGRW